MWHNRAIVYQGVKPCRSLLLTICYMLASVAMAVLFSLTYLLITPARELRLIKQGNVACALSFGGALLGFCLALASAMTHSLNILDFILWSAGAAIVQIGAYFATTRLVPDAGRELQQNNIAVGALYCALSLAIGVLNAACLVDG